ncbi:glycosyltransferase family 39 protein [Nostoc sp. FACHB-152]|uniref:glycosyltransferase family 39 protein n=1 Tax=unclassified Nostoc TaxID=2593658 RepID=UPI001684A293|nr:MULTISPECIES: glycosyltransferase family 39 protein [unclassified Nostoc]MBD2452258.1 glycosyltransferase family 39 protein [Nostoc sp. FACHB-152]MBD2473170.1 glycosyltransferase family 39 protein [Nostoc sp. FACHB-145]
MPKFKSILWQLLYVSLFFGFILAIRFKPITQAFELDYDEGLNLIKVLLYSQGFSLYTQVWNDQPPLFTVILSIWFSIFGQSVIAARLLILIFSSLLLWCFFQIINRDLGKIPAFVASILLVTSWLFIRVSISVMIGIPALALTMLSIYLLTLYKKHGQQYLLILSGTTLALSLQTKLFTVFLIPLILFYICDFKLRIGKLTKIAYHPIIYWLGTLGITYIIIFLLSKQFYSYDQLFQSHLNQPIEEGLVNFNNVKFLTYMITQDYDYIFLGFVGILAILWKKQRNGFFPLIWLGTTILIFLTHKPIWYHYYPLLAIPICWLAAYGVTLLLELFTLGWDKNLKFWNIKLIFPSLILVTMMFLIIATPPVPKGMPRRNGEIMQLVTKYKDSTQWVFTDRPIYAFYAGLRVPPEMAVMSYKRLNSGSLSSQKLLTILQQYRPEQIVLARWTDRIKSDRKIMDYINEHYFKTYTSLKGDEEHYIWANKNKTATER